MIIWVLSTWMAIGQLPLLIDGVSQPQKREISISMINKDKEFKSSTYYLYEYCNGCSLKRMSRKELIALKLTKLIAVS